MTSLIMVALRQCWMVVIFNILAVCRGFQFEGSSTSFSKFSPWTPCHNGTIEFEFKTQLPNALMFYTDSGNAQANDDYFELKLVDGIMYLLFKLNKENDMMTSVMGNLNDNEWHSVKLMRAGRQTTLIVDEQTLVKEHVNYDSEYQTFDGTSSNYIFVGGLPLEYNTQLEKLAHSQVMFEPRLSGSVRNLFYSNCGKEMVTPDLVDSDGLVVGEDRCLRDNPCLHGGICVVRDDGIKCDCSYTQFNGEHCQMERQAVEAMFKGMQYLTYDLTQRGDPIFSANDHLSLYFKTTQSNGLLFFTGESNDYMTVTLKNGAVQVAMDLGSGKFEDTADMGGYKLDDGQWHHLKVTRNTRQVFVDVDDFRRVMGMTQGEFTKLSSNQLFLGGAPDPARLPGSDITSNFQGCMKQVEFKADSISLELIELAKADHNLISVIGDVIFGQCEDVVESQPVTFMTPESFIAMPKWDIKKKNGTISFQFRTTEPDGLIMYNSAQYGSSNLDFFGLEIIDGHFYLVMALGTGAIKEKISRNRVDDGLPHTVYLMYRGKTGLIRIDSHEYDYLTPGMGMELDLEDMLFVGGLDFERYNAYRLPKELWSGILKQGYVGCLQDLKINNDKVDLMMVARKQHQKDIRNECRKLEPQCSSQQCMHRGTCTEGWNRYICDCRNTSYRGRNCEHAATTLSFDEAQYVLVTLPEETSTEAEDISLRFRTIKARGLLLLTRGTMTDDSIELFLERGACKLTISLGPRSRTLSVGHNLNDNAWHTVFIKRSGQKVEFWVDTSGHVIDTIAQVAITLKVKKILLGSVSPLLSGTQSLSEDSMMMNDAPVPSYTFFVGEMQQFVYNGNHFFDTALEKTVESIEVTSRFDPGASLTRDAVTFQSGQSYVALPHQIFEPNSLHFALSFAFKTRQKSGLLLYSGLNGPDFLALELMDGYLFYIYDMGGGSKRTLVNTPEPLNDDKWHDISLFRPQLDQQQIRVDSNPATVEDMKGYPARHFDLKGPLYVGGLLKTRYYQLSMKISSRNGFLGCLASLDINGKRIDILESATNKDVLAQNPVSRGCSSSAATCDTNSCAHGGRCEQQWNSYVCNCEMTTYTGSRCMDESITYEIGLDDGLIAYEYPGNDQPTTKQDYLAIGISTIQNEASILRIDSAETNDYIEMELVNGNIFMVYNMGLEDIPVVTLEQAVNDGRYHVIKFVRSGANASLQVDWEKRNKNPMGQKMTVFNSQARVMIGGRLDSHGRISKAFHGTVSGLVYNGVRILDQLKHGDPRVRSEGDVSLVQREQPVQTPPQHVEVHTEGEPSMQSTQGVKEKLNKRSTNEIEENSARHRKKNKHKEFDAYYTYYHQKANLVDRDSREPRYVEPVVPNEVRPKTLPAPAVYPVHGNSAKVSPYHTNTTPVPSLGPILDTGIPMGGRVVDHTIGGDIFSTENLQSFQDTENDDTEFQSSGYSSVESFAEKLLRKISIWKKKKTKHKHWKTKASATFPFQITNSHIPSSDNSVPKISVGKFQRPPFAIDDRHNRVLYPKDRGKSWRRRRPHKHSSSTTPRQGVTDDIIFSGQGPDCFNVDEECLTTSDDDDIITPNIIITRLTTPKPEPSESSGIHNETCKDCQPQGTELDPNINMDNTTYNIARPRPDVTLTNRSASEKSSTEKDHFNIFLAICIAAGVIVIALILAVLLYRFRRRDEGTYRVDESQNFAYLEAKKQQTNGAAVTSVGNGKTSGKKRDVKEWYV
ncbi:neurexin-1-like isoform X2 [Mya arenaria]|uniref:neurexin-1-like isoform X2 n=1 Tax=Mya arenaria TaxID=6604 RepID=UPI0022E1615E|nr:neurexin-1-like isoform X2 [Mya arenaria]